MPGIWQQLLILKVVGTGDLFLFFFLSSSSFLPSFPGLLLLLSLPALILPSRPPSPFSFSFPQMGFFPFIFHDHGFFKHFMRGKYMPASSDLASTFQGIEWDLYFFYVLSTYLSNGHEIILMYLKHWIWPTAIHTHTLSHIYTYIYVGFPGGSGVKNPTANARDTSLIHELGRSPGGGNVNPLQYPCLENPMDRGAWQATVYGITQLSDWAHTHTHTHTHTHKYIVKTN